MLTAFVAIIGVHHPELRSMLVGSDEPGFVVEGEFEQTMATAEVELESAVGAVVFDGAVTDPKFGSDLLAGFVHGDHSQDAAFGGG